MPLLGLPVGGLRSVSLAQAPLPPGRALRGEKQGAQARLPADPVPPWPRLPQPGALHVLPAAPGAPGPSRSLLPGLSVQVGLWVS